MMRENIKEASPKVSVVCAWYNRAEYICDTIDSLLAQDFKSFEVVVINDGSSDPRVREILNKYNDSRLRVIHQENTGFTMAIRRAINESLGDFVAIMGAGDVASKDRIRLQYETINNDSKLGAVSCYYENRHMLTGQSDIQMPPERMAWKNGDIIPRGFSYSHGEIMYRRLAYTEVGGYRTFFTYGQGSDLWRRLLVAGWEIAAVNKELYQRRIFDDGVAVNSWARAQRLVYSAISIADVETRMPLKSTLDYLLIDGPQIDVAYAKGSILLAKAGMRKEAAIFRRRALMTKRLKPYFIALLSLSQWLSKFIFGFATQKKSI